MQYGLLPMQYGLLLIAPSAHAFAGGWVKGCERSRRRMRTSLVHAAMSVIIVLIVTVAIIISEIINIGILIVRALLRWIC